MRALINGLLYDTDKAQQILETRSKDVLNRVIFKALYKTYSGKSFIVINDEIKSVTDEEAVEFLIDSEMSTEEIREHYTVEDA